MSYKIKPSPMSSLLSTFALRPPATPTVAHKALFHLRTFAYASGVGGFRIYFGDEFKDMRKRGDSRTTPDWSSTLHVTLQVASSFSSFIAQPALNTIQLNPIDALNLSPVTPYPFHQDWWNFQHRSRYRLRKGSARWCGPVSPRSLL